ncbi:MAG: hypothetical protein HGA46_02025 [Chlorobiaceae bacterium]|nr:hypothetical protein [Chlorobiaceae bacterium]
MKKRAIAASLAAAIMTFGNTAGAAEYRESYAIDQNHHRNESRQEQSDERFARNDRQEDGYHDRLRQSPAISDDFRSVKATLELDDRQLDRFIAIRQDYREHTGSVYREIALLKEIRQNEEMQKHRNFRTIARLNRKISVLQDDLNRYRIRSIRNYREVCNNQQRERFDRFSVNNSPIFSLMFRF